MSDSHDARRMSGHEPTRRPSQATADRRYLLAVLGVPVVVLGTGLGLVAGVWSRLPSSVASHWGPDGVDATAAPVPYLIGATALIAAISLLLAAAGWFTPTDGRRLVAAVAAATSGFLAVVLLGGLVAQRDLVDPTLAPSPSWLFLLAAVAAAVLGCAGWALAGGRAGSPAPPADRAPLPQGAPTVPVAPGERLAWFGHTAQAPWLAWVCVALVALACFCAVVAAPWAALGPVVAIALVLLLMRARVTVDADGLRVDSVGLTWLRLPLEAVSHAETSSLVAFKEFGGLGMRYRQGARAFVTRTGEALLVVGRDGTRTYVSMDDSASAAAVINTLSRRTPSGTTWADGS